MIQNKLVVDPNSAYFGTADSYQKFDKRLKSGGKSSSNNNLTLTLPSDGTLKVYARTGSSSATNRNVILTQNDAELANKILLESEAVSVNMLVDGVEVAKKVYPAVSVAVKAGDVSITYPAGSINFYGFEFVAAGTTGISDIQAPKSSKDGATFNLLGQKVANDAKGIVIKNGKKFINK